MEQIGKIKVLFILGFGPIVRDTTASRNLYRQTLGISFKEEKDGYPLAQPARFDVSDARPPSARCLMPCSMPWKTIR